MPDKKSLVPKDGESADEFSARRWQGKWPQRTKPPGEPAKKTVVAPGVAQKDKK